jgi:5-methylcytosine-specific restriction endonuclease McrA
MTALQRTHHSWRRLAREAIAAHVEAMGWTCPGWGVPAHESRDLTGDHEIPRVGGGLSTPANVQVLCRSCNAR